MYLALPGIASCLVCLTLCVTLCVASSLTFSSFWLFFCLCCVVGNVWLSLLYCFIIRHLLHNFFYYFSSLCSLFNPSLSLSLFCLLPNIFYYVLSLCSFFNLSLSSIFCQTFSYLFILSSVPHAFFLFFSLLSSLTPFLFYHFLFPCFLFHPLLFFSLLPNLLFSCYLLSLSPLFNPSRSFPLLSSLKPFLFSYFLSFHSLFSLSLFLSSVFSQQRLPLRLP